MTVEYKIFEYSELKIGQHKTIFPKVYLELTRIVDDEFSEYVETPAPQVKGEFHFESFQIHARDHHPVQKNVQATLILGTHPTSKFNIRIGEKVNEIVVVPDKVKKYCWLFDIVDVVYDKLCIMDGIVNKNKAANRVFVSTNFRGFWPSEVASVVVAPNVQIARKLLDEELANKDIPQSQVRYDLKEIDLNQSQATILASGEE